MTTHSCSLLMQHQSIQHKLNHSELLFENFVVCLSHPDSPLNQIDQDSQENQFKDQFQSAVVEGDFVPSNVYNKYIPLQVSPHGGPIILLSKIIRQ